MAGPRDYKSVLQLAHFPVSPQLPTQVNQELMVLELQDGACFRGYSFGASTGVAGELVFQTGMVGYPESLTDPSYRGQILVMTFPLIGNYGVPSMQTMDHVLNDLPAYFESTKVHVAGLITASYAGEDYSHYLASSSLGTWLRNQGVPAIYGVDTRAVTKLIRQEGSMLGRLMRLSKPQSGSNHLEAWQSGIEWVNWVNPNVHNLVADGKGTGEPLQIIRTVTI